jgi:hypothetical protein
MDVRQIKNTIENLQGELAATEREFERLSASRAKLQGAINSLSLLLEDAPAELGRQISFTLRTENAEINTTQAPVPKWTLIRDAFPRSGGTMTVPELYKEVNKNGIVISNPDAIRVALRRRPEMFVNTGGGRFALSEHMLQRDVRNGQEATEVAS